MTLLGEVELVVFVVEGAGEAIVWQSEMLFGVFGQGKHLPESR